MSNSIVGLPFITVADPAVRDEGAIDPLGFSTVADRLADWVLPGMTTRMARPRFLTAIAASAAVCESCCERPAGDGASTPNTVFEWLVVEGFVRKAERTEVRQTPGIEKATVAKNEDQRLSAKLYLKSPTVVGFHGVYKRLAQNVGLIDDEFRLNESGYQLLRTWEREQGLDGFADGRGSVFRSWRDAVLESYEAGHVTRSGTWGGWEQLAQHLSPSRIGKQEERCLWQLLINPAADQRGEVFSLVAQPECRMRLAESLSDHDAVACLAPLSSSELAMRWRVIEAFESVASLLDDAFQHLQFVSTSYGTRALAAMDFELHAPAREFARLLPSRLDAALQRLADSPAPIPDMFDRIAASFQNVSTASGLFEALLKRHSDVQKAKPPQGKREWFERATDDRVMVRPQYRQDEPPSADPYWRRPYRLRTAVRSFCDDLHAEAFIGGA